MKKQLLATSLISTTLFLTACVTAEEKLIADGATWLDASQVKTHIVGKTEKWSKGGGYYAPNGTIETLWEGAEQSGTYTIAADGTVCYEVETWDKECHYYLNKGGKISLMYNGKYYGEYEVLVGNQLSTF